jgi:Domain of unknown function (DUF4184)
MSALIVGTFAPDFEYFLTLTPQDRFGHSLAGVFVMTLPLALVVFWLFEYVVKAPVMRLLPDAIRNRLAADRGRARLSGVPGFAWIVVSALIGIATHLVWDAFTHSTTWLYRHWSFLSRTAQVPIIHQTQYYKLFQHASTVVGMCILTAWFIHWYRTTKPAPEPPRRLLSPSQRVLTSGLILTIAFFSAMARAFAGVGMPRRRDELQMFAGEAVVTFVALIWWQLVAYGLFFLKGRATLRPDDLAAVSKSPRERS